TTPGCRALGGRAGRVDPGHHLDLGVAGCWPGRSRGMDGQPAHPCGRCAGRPQSDRDLDRGRLTPDPSVSFTQADVRTGRTAVANLDFGDLKPFKAPARIAEKLDGWRPLPRQKIPAL